MLCKELMTAPALRLSETGRERFPELQSYLAYMKQSFGNRVDDLKLESVAGLEISPDGRLVIKAIDKIAINRALHEFLPNPESDTKPVTPALNPEIERLLGRIAVDRFDSARKGIEGSITRVMENIKTRTASLAGDFKQLAKLRTDLNMLMNGSGDNAIVSAVKKILADGFWKNVQFHSIEKIITFDSDDIWLNYSDPDAQVNKRINIGAFRMKFWVSEGVEVTFSMIRNNIQANGHPHPHLNAGSGDVGICLGNASASWTDAVNALDLAKMAHIARVILTEYNPDNPYVEFRRFEEEFNRRQKLALRTPQDEQQIRNEYNERVNNSVPGETDWYDSLVPAF